MRLKFILFHMSAISGSYRLFSLLGFISIWILFTSHTDRNKFQFLLKTFKPSDSWFNVSYSKQVGTFFSYSSKA